MQPWFIPGTPAPARGPLARYRTAQPVGAVGAYVERLARPGDLVVDLFCQGPTVVREAAAAGRRALGFSVNPLLLLVARLGLSRPQPGALNAAFTRLADSPKGDLPLRRYLASLYRSACPTCGTPGVAEWLAWERDGNRPFRKAVRCSRCEGLREGAPDDEDVEAARRSQPRGLAYYYALDRVAPLADPLRERTAELVALYTPRNLSALMDLAMRLEGLEASEEVKLALTGVLLDCFDLGSSLDPYGEERPRPRTLRLPARYLERNVWMCFEERFSRLLAEDGRPALAGVSRLQPGLPLDSASESGQGLGSTPVSPPHGGVLLESCPARDAGKIVPPGSVALIFADPPRPDGVFWALSALWAGWLWQSPAARALRPFLRRRRFDWDWHWRVLQTALEEAGPLLAPDGYLITSFSDPDDTLLESVCLAASGAGYALEGWGYSHEVGYRLVWRWDPQTANRGSSSMADGVDQLERDVVAVAAQAPVSALRERGEPVAWVLLHAGVYTELARRGLLARVAALPEGGPPALAFISGAVHRAREAAPLLQLTDQVEAGGALWWLTDARRTAEPLADRVELAVRDLLLQQPIWHPDELIAAVYAHFPGPLTPGLALVQVCIASYSVPEGQVLHLRPEDEPRRRAAELQALRGDLDKLGRRLGFDVKRRGGGWDVRWLEEGREAYVFAIVPTAVISPRLLGPPARNGKRATGEGAYRCLALPGGRAQLVGLKLHGDPRLAQAVAAGRWQFCKFRHLRRLVAEPELDRHALKTVLGLDPIAEQEAVQIPLF